MVEMEETELLTLIAYVQISSYRARTLQAIGNGVSIPTKIAKKAGIRPNHVSKVLAELKRNGLCVCLNEDVRKGRLYRLTPLGIVVLEALKE